MVLVFMTYNIRNETIEIGAFVPHPANYNRHPDEQIGRLAMSLEMFGQPESVTVWDHPHTDADGEQRAGYFIAGHGVREAASQLAWTHLRADVLPADYPEELALAYIPAANRLAQLSDPDEVALARLLDAAKAHDEQLLEAIGYNEDEFQAVLDAAGGGLGVTGGEPGADTEPETSRAEELQKEWSTELGQLWQCGPHRVISGDCTDRAVVERLMGGAKAALVHADPPYGMGKEKDGIANDNLYREKLDKFQMQWWGASRSNVEDNGSAYIWGNAEDLWRLWYCGGLKDSERLTFRNEVIWDKANESGLYDGNGIGSDIGRQYASISERCLFFMLGEQGFNNNADNYWEGWEPIRTYLKEQRDLMGWDNAKCKEIAGHSPKSGCHWFDSSQWSFVTEDVYNAWKDAANGKAFQREYDELKREYDELKREFYSTRAYFDNMHDLMTDVWNYPRVQGDDRHGHATPKPIEMIERALKSSAPDGGIVYAPFLGTGPEIIAAHNLNRVCYGCEISPAYVAVILQRYRDHTGIEPKLVEN